jgi:rhamnosyltransferase
MLNIAILIPTLNAGENWLSLLTMIDDQSITVNKKIIIDSGSNDNTIEDAISYGFEVIIIKKVEFNHGKTRQHLVDLADNIDICVFLTQDAILASRDSIANIVNAFDDPEVGMAYGRQLPHKNAQPLETHARLFNYPSNSEILSLTDLD